MHGVPLMRQAAFRPRMRRSAFRAAGVRMVCATLLSPCARTAHEAIKRPHPHRIHLQREVAGTSPIVGGQLLSATVGSLRYLRPTSTIHMRSSGEISCVGRTESCCNRSDPALPWKAKVSRLLCPQRSSRLRLVLLVRLAAGEAQLQRPCGRRTLATCLRASSLAFHMLNDRLLDRYIHLGTRIRPHTLSQCREHTTSKRAERL